MGCRPFYPSKTANAPNMAEFHRLRGFPVTFLVHTLLTPMSAATTTPAMIADRTTRPFWVSKSLEEMTPEEWESLCDGCGKCCLAKLEDEDSGEIYWTSVACRLFHAGTCRCTDYENRLSLVPDCVDLTPEKVRALPWLPSSCAYRLVAEGKALPSWHHLVCGDPQRIHLQGESMRGRVKASECELNAPEDYFPFVLDDEP